MGRKRSSTHHEAGCFDQTDHDLPERRGDLALCQAKINQIFGRSLRCLVEFHDKILDHGRLGAWMTEKPEAIVANLKQRRLVCLVDGKYARGGREDRPIAHVDDQRIALRQMACERPGLNPVRAPNRKAERFFRSTASGGGGKKACPETDAEHRKFAREKVTQQPGFGGEARNEMTAYDAERSGAKHDEAVEAAGICRDGRARRERTNILKSDRTAFKMVFHETEELGFGMLKDTEGLHNGQRRMRSDGDAAQKDVIRRKKNSVIFPAWHQALDK